MLRTIYISGSSWAISGVEPENVKTGGFQIKTTLLYVYKQ